MLFIIVIIVYLQYLGEKWKRKKSNHLPNTPRSDSRYSLAIAIISAYLLMCGLDRQAKIPAFFVITWGNRELGEEETQDTADRILASRGFGRQSGSPCQNKQVQINHVELKGIVAPKQTTLPNQHLHGGN